ncbi:C6 zinc finger protein [Gaeumannomyces tritici R3-111a-1]|uniref:C6 zinc finger protein n=1 Tax=Gaeumannomyces tritici (strain R3-111a-1) TaxID=644352 RepID=J3NXK0_GAET3|nr:C6 zinc finger protein [Gaeumannomyces tritici R3-111a-1]EJT76082.1 C6 zinc finger protein [Gaeumannomyces tritici R3-111a-1]
MTTAVKRACDACHRRKVKCDGINPCRNCSSAQLSCTYNAIPQKKGPKGSRAKVISELRETQRQTSLATKVHNRIHGAVSPPASPTLSPTPGLLTKEIVKECVDFYFGNMYSIIPILNRQQLERDTTSMETNVDIYCLLTSLCAFMMLQPGMSMPGGDPYGLDVMPGANIVTGTLLMEETIRVRKAYDHIESPTPNSLCTSYFLFACYYALDLHDKAWFHLREATTVAHMTGMTKEDSYVGYDNASASRRRRLYWLLFVTERAYALQRGRPLTLQASINLPTTGDDPSDQCAHQLGGFVLLAKMFRPFDDQFVNLWNNTKESCSSSYVDGLQKQFADALPAYLNVTDPRLGDVHTNQTWLKNIVWQLSMSRMSSNEQGMASMRFPIDVSQELLAMTSAFSTRNMELISGGFVEKLYEVASSLTEVLALQPNSDPFAVFNPRDSLQHILNLLGLVRNGESRFLPLLMCKMNDVLPRLISPMLQKAPEMACNIDIFDGFGNGGLGNVSAMAPMDEYESKFAIPRVEEFKSEPASSSGGSAVDMNSPFVSSPVVLSPSVDFPNGLSSQDFNSMTDMVMSPVGPAPGSHLSTPGGIPGQQPLPQSRQHPSPLQHQSPQQHQHQHQQYSQQHPPHQAQHQQSIAALQGANNSINTHFQNSMHSGMSQAPRQQGLRAGIDHGFGVGQIMNNSLGQLGQTMMTGSQGMMMRQQPGRTNSFSIAQAPHLRTVGDFQALQRTNSDMSVMTSMSGMSGGGGGMNAEIDFNTLPAR